MMHDEANVNNLDTEGFICRNSNDHFVDRICDNLVKSLHFSQGFVSFVYLRSDVAERPEVDFVPSRQLAKKTSCWC